MCLILKFDLAVYLLLLSYLGITQSEIIEMDILKAVVSEMKQCNTDSIETRYVVDSFPSDFKFKCAFRTPIVPDRAWDLLRIVNDEGEIQWSITVDPLENNIYSYNYDVGSFLDDEDCKVNNTEWHYIEIEIGRQDIFKMKDHDAVVYNDCKGFVFSTTYYNGKNFSTNGQLSIAQYEYSNQFVESIEIDYMEFSNSSSLWADCDNDMSADNDDNFMVLINADSNAPSNPRITVLPSTESLYPCHLEETHVQEETGIRGLPGPIGPMGPRGQAGLRGPVGPAGEKGAQGETGTPGLPGPIGQTGPRGQAGLRGRAGPLGEKGAQGETGTPGMPGSRGPAGLRGRAGPSGEKGAQGETGIRGLPGPIGPPGPIGSRGPVGPSGEKGAQGIPGTTGLQGAMGPTGPRGESGLRGELGPPGEKGAQGEIGVPGVHGFNGLSGPRGQSGPRGLVGPPGQKGEQGIQGPVGPPVDATVLDSRMRDIGIRILQELADIRAEDNIADKIHDPFETVLDTFLHRNTRTDVTPT